MVYYVHTDRNGHKPKFPAVVLNRMDDEATIRIGRLDVLTQKIVTAEYTVSVDKLSQRNTPCNYETDLRGDDFQDQ